LEGEDFLAGDPTLFGPGGDDSLAGGPGEDQVYGRGDDDAVSGGPGKDEISGTLGADAVSGGDGDDLVDDGPHLDAAVDEISGGSGDDVMDAFNDPAGVDVVLCGSGDDLVYTDETDEISEDCETTVRGPHPDPWDARFGVTR
jgi:Ca2+-binding RTX toxin-like protein